MRPHLFRPSSFLLAAAMAAGLAVAAAGQEQPKQQPKQQPQTKPQERQQQQAMKAELDDLEKHPEKFLGQTVTVQGKVRRVLGPHLFTVHEAKWLEMGREVPVVVPDPFAAIVQKDAEVKITGTVEKVPIARVQEEPGFRNEEKIRAEIETKPTLVANELTAIQSGVVLRIRPEQPVGTSGTAGAGATAITDADMLAKAQPKDVVGKRVDLNDATVAGVTDHGFWINTASGKRLFVSPTEKGKVKVKEGQRVSVHGTVLEMPDGLKKDIKPDNDIYIYADRIAAK